MRCGMKLFWSDDPDFGRRAAESPCVVHSTLPEEYARLRASKTGVFVASGYTVRTNDGSIVKLVTFEKGIH